MNILLNVPTEILEQKIYDRFYYNGTAYNFDYVADLFNHIFKFEPNCTNVPISSKLLLHKYGKGYKIYVQLLQSLKYIRLTSNHSTDKKTARRYGLNPELMKESLWSKYKCFNKKFLRQNTRRWKCELTYSNINEFVKMDLEKNLEHVTIDYDKAMEFIKNYVPQPKKLNWNKYRTKYSNYDSTKSNKQAIERIVHHDYYRKFDNYGRFHTNLTNLKKEIRKNYIFIDGESITEKDIPNSQPLFLLRFILDYHRSNMEYVDVASYKEAVCTGKLYDIIMDFSTKKDKDRNYFKGKTLIHIYDRPKNVFKEFSTLFPDVEKFIRRYKTEYSYETLSHEMMRLESDFVFNRVCAELSKKGIVYFTVHDSVYVKVSDKEVLQNVFDKHYNKFIAEIEEMIQGIAYYKGKRL